MIRNASHSRRNRQKGPDQQNGGAAAILADVLQRLRLLGFGLSPGVLLTLAGCSNSEIASITGNVLRDVDAILDTHYLGGRDKIADEAIAKLEAAQKR